MIVVLRPEITEEAKRHVLERIRGLELKPMVSDGVERTIVGVLGDTSSIETSVFEELLGVEQVIRVTRPFKLVGREFRPQNSVVRAGSVEIGGRRLAVAAGPCSVEGREMILSCAKAVKASGAMLLRGGAFKPRTSPYSFQGLGEEGLKYLAEAREITGLAVVTEAMAIHEIELVARYADMIQIGARNMQNYRLLKEVGRVRKPVLLKRGMSSTIEELLMSAEYILAEGNFDVVLCERGIRTFETYTRNTLDLGAVPAIKSLSHLPVLVDPSHGTGRRSLILPMAMAAVAAGADGLIVEVHPEPEKALSDGAQSLLPAGFADLMKSIRPVAEAVGREV